MAVTFGAVASLVLLVGVFSPPFALLILLVVGGFGLVTAAHYLVWGRWLRRLAEKDEANRGEEGP